MPADQSLDWHRRALSGEKVPYHEDEIHCGWYVRRLEYRGPFFPCRIFWEGVRDPETGELVEDEKLRCEVAGQRRDPAEEWVWISARPISEAEYNALISELLSGRYIGPQRTKSRWLTEEELPR